MRRDDFKETTKKKLAQRAGYNCSNPNCRQKTIGAHSDPEKSTSIGVAAHISAASKGGPRFDKELTSIDRKSIQNGIWLCENCATLIDKDPEKYHKKLLISWKLKIEGESKQNLHKFISLTDQFDSEHDKFIKGIKGVEYSCEDGMKGKDYIPEYDNTKLFPSKIVFFFNQLDFEFKANFENGVRVNLPSKFSIGYETKDNECFMPKLSNKYFIGQYDFDDDGIKEIVIGIKDISISSIQINVIKFYPPLQQNNLNRNENWKLIGEMHADLINPCFAQLIDGSVRMSRGIRGFYYEWTYVKGKFISTGNI